MSFKIRKMILVSLATIICMFLILVINYSNYKKDANREIAELKSEISNMKDRLLIVEEELVHISSKEAEETPEQEIEDDVSVEAEQMFYLSNYQRQVVECIVMGESGGEPYDGQVAVAQCILNACLKDNLQPSEVKTKYKYSGWNTNPTESVKQAVSAVFDDGYKITDKCIMYFYAPKYSKGSWHETQQFVMEIGGHRFFAEK